MRYCGSKRRFMKDLTPILMEHVNEETLFVDAFCGGANVISAIPHDRKVGIEINRYVAALWQYLQSNGMEGIPETVSEADYKTIKTDYLSACHSYPDWLVGYVGTCCSYGGAWFNGYARFNPKRNEDHIREAYNNLKRQVEHFIHLRETRFMLGSYEDFAYPENCVIYCDPPYAGTKKYESDFDTISFWGWARDMSKSGRHVYVSEYEAPYDFKCIWSQTKVDGMGTVIKGKKPNRMVEKLFVYDGKI